MGSGKEESVKKHLYKIEIEIAQRCWRHQERDGNLCWMNGTCTCNACLQNRSLGVVLNVPGTTTSSLPHPTRQLLLSLCAPKESFFRSSNETMANKISVTLPEGQVPVVQKRTLFCQQSQLGCQVILKTAKMKTTH